MVRYGFRPGKLWFEEDESAYVEKRNNFLIGAMVALVVIILLVIMFITIQLMLGAMTSDKLVFWIPVFIIFLTIPLVFSLRHAFKGKPMQFYENGIQTTKIGWEFFKPYTHFCRITEERNPVWGKAFHLRHKSPLGWNVVIPRYSPKMEKYISRIRDKIEEGEREEATPFIRE